MLEQPWKGMRVRIALVIARTPATASRKRDSAGSAARSENAVDVDLAAKTKT